jgi:hypothetical protein
MNAKLFLLLFLNNFASCAPKIVQTQEKKKIGRSNAANFLQICANLQKYWNNAMSNDGSNVEIIDQSHGVKSRIENENIKTLCCLQNQLAQP